MEKQENYMQRVGPYRCNQCAFQTEDGNELTRHFLEFHSGLNPSAEQPASDPERVSDGVDLDELWDKHSEAVQLLEDAGDYRAVIKKRDFERAVNPLLDELRTLRAQLAELRPYSHETVRAAVGWRDARIRELQTQLADRDNHIKYAYAALGDANRNIYLFDHIRKLKGQLAQKDAAIEKAWQDALEEAALRLEGQGQPGYAAEIRALAAEKKEG